MYCKLNKTFQIPIYAVTDGLKTFTGENDKGIDYKKIWSPESEFIYGVLPERYWNDFHLTIMTINRDIPAHTDTEIITTINFYIKTDNCRTVFFEPIVEEPRKFQIKNQTDGYIFNEEDLKEIDSFVAKDNEVWVLDVKKIHSVQGNPTLRKAITLGTRIHNYEAVCEMLKETGCV
jgi:hypothetical protein